MDRKTATENIKKRVKELVEQKEGGDFTFRYDNMPFTRPEGTKGYIRVRVSWTSRRQVSFGSSTKRFRNRGNLVFTLHTALDQGDGEIIDIADRISSHFQTTTVDSIVWQTPDSIPVGRAGKWWQTNLVCPFYFDELE